MLSADLDAAATQARALEAANAQLTQQLADARSTIALQTAHVADLEHQLADCKASTQPPTTTPPPVPSALRFGAYKPWFPADLATFVSVTGKSQSLAMQYADSRYGYDQISNPWIWGAPPGGGVTWAAWLKADTSRRFVFSVPLMIDADKGNYTSAAADAAHKALAQRLVALGVDGQVILRLGWECNGDWYPWSTNRDGYKSMFRRLVGIYRAASPKFRFAWNIAIGAYDYERSQDFTLWYPGDDVVDIATGDIYDQQWQRPGGDPAARWNVQLPALQSYTDFAAKHGKPGAIDEWSLVLLTAPNLGGGGDSPLFVSNLLKWCKDHAFAWECVFDDGGGGLYLRLADAPKGLAAYKVAAA